MQDQIEEKPKMTRNRKRHVVTTSWSLTPDLLEAVRADADRRGVSQAKVIRKILREYYQTKPSKRSNQNESSTGTNATEG